ncbi:pneumococcal-type histidine triad protein, partial [Streptococcus pneumoniae]|uniref:pneumococcal-type histidine triad protein n=1 Tax=Streptococcus pneumoniae TaxID=1313 RepID=UPI000B123C21
MKINKKYLAGSVAVLALSVCSYELGRHQAGQVKKESNRVAYIDGDQAGQKAENLTPDEVSKREGINAEQIVIKITDQGYVTSHGDHYQEPSPRQLTEIQEFVKTYKVKTIFTESNASSKVAETLVKSTGVGLKTLNPLESDPQ